MNKKFVKEVIYTHDECIVDFLLGLIYVDECVDEGVLPSFDDSVEDSFYDWCECVYSTTLKVKSCKVHNNGDITFVVRFGYDLGFGINTTLTHLVYEKEYNRYRCIDRDLTR